MSRKFDRRIEVTAGVPGGLGKTWTDLDISFEVELSNGRRSNKASVKILNLGDASIGLLEEKDVVVEVSAGYGSIVGPIFVGSITPRGVKTSWSGTTRTTLVSAVSDSKAYKRRTAASYAAGIKAKAILQDLARTMQVGEGNIGDVAELEYTTGHVLMGNASDAFNQVAVDLGMQWSIQDGQIQILKTGELLPGQAILLTPSSGLIGSAQRAKGGVSLNAMFDLNFKIGGQIKIESRDVTGFFKIQKIKHSCNNRAGQFISILEGKAV